MTIPIEAFKQFLCFDFNTPPKIETAPAGIFLPLAVLLALGLINFDSSSSSAYTGNLKDFVSHQTQ